MDTVQQLGDDSGPTADKLKPACKGAVIQPVSSELKTSLKPDTNNPSLE